MVYQKQVRHGKRNLINELSFQIYVIKLNVHLLYVIWISVNSHSTQDAIEEAKRNLPPLFSTIRVLWLSTMHKTYRK